MAVDLEKAEAWIGRAVRIVGGFPENEGEEGVVLAVDPTRYRPSAWMKITEYGSGYPSYRSVDLCWLEDIETGEYGPVRQHHVKEADNGG